MVILCKNNILMLIRLYERDVSFQSDYCELEHEYVIVFALISLPLFIVNNKQ